MSALNSSTSSLGQDNFALFAPTALLSSSTAVSTSKAGLGSLTVALGVAAAVFVYLIGGHHGSSRWRALVTACHAVTISVVIFSTSQFSFSSVHLWSLWALSTVYVSFSRAFVLNFTARDLTSGDKDTSLAVVVAGQFLVGIASEVRL